MTDTQLTSIPVPQPEPSPKKQKLKLRIAHQVPGRIRLKMSGAKGDRAQLEQVRQAFGLIPGIEKVDVNHDTGSVILKYNTQQHTDFHASHRHYEEHVESHRPPKNEYDELANKIEQEAEFLADHSHAARVVVDFCKNLDREIKAASGNTIDFKILLVAGLVGITIFEIGTTAATPVWVTLVLFGMNHFIEMQSEQRSQASRLSPAAA